MADAAPSPLYSVDTNTFMDWQARYYPVDVFASLVPKFDGLIVEGRLWAPALVREEIAAVGTTALNGWADANRRIFVPNSDVIADALAIQKLFPGLLDPKAEYEEADAYVIALAKTRNGIVITQETSAAEKRNPRRTHFIPDVCREMGIPCFNLLGLLRREGWTL